MAIKNSLSLVIDNIKNYFATNKKMLINIGLSMLLFVIIVLNSGYALTYLNADTLSRTIVSVASFVIVGFVFALTMDISVIIGKFKKRKPTWCFIALCIFTFSALLTMFCSGELLSFVSYLSFLIQVFSAYLLAKLLNLRKLISIYQTGLLIICFIAIFFYIIENAFGVTLTPFSQFITFKGGVYNNYFFLSFQSATDTRMQGPFWEPGLLSTFLLLGLTFEIVFYKKVRWVYIITFLVAIFLSKSTFGILLLIIILLFVVNKKVKSLVWSAVFYFLIFGTVVIFFVFATPIITWLASIFPDVFSKMIKGGRVVLIDPDRYLSPSTNFQIWFLSPVWGNGLQGADRIFEQMMPNMAQTSTMTFYLSQFGVLGIAFTFFFFFGLWKIKTISTEDKIVLTLLFVILLNKEPHNGIIFDWLLLFLFLKEGWDKDKTALAFEKPNDKSVISSFTKNDDASILKRNISVSFIIKGLALVFGFFSYPIYRAYFNNDSVIGVWLSVLSLMAMIISFDLGLGNGLKNKIIKPLLDNDKAKQKELISSTYFSTTAISILVLIVLTPIIFFSNLNGFFQINPTVISPTILKTSVFLVCLSICIEFTLKNVNSLLQAKQKQALSSTFALLSTVLLMLYALIFKGGDPEKLLISISIAYIFTINVPLLLGTIYTFIKEYKGCAPSFKCVSKQAIKDVSTLGLGFFVIQVLLIAINSTNETFITSIFGPSQVVEYTNYYKPFSIISQLFVIVTLPYWAIVAKEKEEHNFKEIISNLKKLFLFMAVFTVLLVALSVVFQPFINLWLGEGAMEVNFIVVILFDIFIIEWMIVSLLSVIANGLSIIKWQIVFFAISAVIKVGGCLLLNLFKDQIPWYYVIVVTVISFVPLIIGETIIVIKAIKKLKGEATNEKVN